MVSKKASVFCPAFRNNTEIILISKKEQSHSSVWVLAQAECLELIQSPGRLLMLRGDLDISSSTYC